MYLAGASVRHEVVVTEVLRAYMPRPAGLVFGTKKSQEYGTLAKRTYRRRASTLILRWFCAHSLHGWHSQGYHHADSPWDRDLQSSWHGWQRNCPKSPANPIGFPGLFARGGLPSIPAGKFPAFRPGWVAGYRGIRQVGLVAGAASDLSLTAPASRTEYFPMVFRHFNMNIH